MIANFIPAEDVTRWERTIEEPDDRPGGLAILRIYAVLADGRRLLWSRSLLVGDDADDALT